MIVGSLFMHHGLFMLVLGAIAFYDPAFLPRSPRACLAAGGALCLLGLAIWHIQAWWSRRHEGAWSGERTLRTMADQVRQEHTAHASRRPYVS